MISILRGSSQERSGTVERITKTFPVFDCDSHINDPIGIWDYVPESKREILRDVYWVDRKTGIGIVNGQQRVMSGAREERISPESTDLAMPLRLPYPIPSIKGPQITNHDIHKIVTSYGSPLPLEVWDYLDHMGAYDPHARVKDMDLMGIDQVLVIPTQLINNLMGVEHDEAMKIV